MARGWESKSVESQIESAAERNLLSNRRQLSAQQIALEREREGLQLSRQRVLNDLAATSNPRYRELLQRSLAYLDEKLAGLEADGNKTKAAAGGH